MIAYVRTHFQRLTRAELAEQFNYSERQVTACCASGRA